MSLKSTSTPVSFPVTADCSHKPLREIAAPKNKGLRQPAHGDRNIETTSLALIDLRSAR